MQNEIYSEAKPNRPPQILTEIDAGEAAGKTWPIYACPKTSHIKFHRWRNSNAGNKSHCFERKNKSEFLGLAGRRVSRRRIGTFTGPP